MGMKREFVIRSTQGGMFLYFIFFHPPKKFGVDARAFGSKVNIHNCMKQQIEPNASKIINSNSKTQKCVRFADKPNIRLIYAWRFAYTQARKDKWQQCGRDRCRFQKKINEFDDMISKVLMGKHEKNFGTWVQIK